MDEAHPTLDFSARPCDVSTVEDDGFEQRRTYHLEPLPDRPEPSDDASLDIFEADDRHVLRLTPFGSERESSTTPTDAVAIECFHTSSASLDIFARNFAYAQGYLVAETTETGAQSE
jgi:hypothetical protein